MLAWLYRLTDAARNRARVRVSPPEAARGRRAEDLAHRFLRRLGYTIVARNYRQRAGAGEIDIVAVDMDTLVFVEVKARSSEEFGPPENAVDREKRRHLDRVAREYARRAGTEWSHVRFDIIAVVLSKPPRIQHLKDAFRAGRYVE